MFGNKNLPQIIIGTAIIITLILGILIYLAPPAIFPDPSWGFQVMRAMQSGGGFNMKVSVSQDDITKNISEFLTWWSPGQYLVPYFFVKAFGLNMGRAAALSIMLCSLAGLAGYFTFFKKIGFSSLTSALSIAFIVCQQFYFIPYIYYNGGEILIFAFSGWFLYGCVTATKANFKTVLFILLSGWVGFFCKSAFMWIYVSGVLFLWIRLSKADKNIRSWLIKGVSLGAPALVTIASIIKFFLSRGENPASSSEGYKLAWETFSFPLASPLLAGFSIDDLFNGLAFTPGNGQLSHAWCIVILLIVAVLSILLVISIIRYIPNNDYVLLTLVFYTMAVLFFSFSFLRQAAISYEGRHFRLIGLLVIPGAIYLVGKIKRPFQVLFAICWIFIAFTSLRFFVSGYRYNINSCARGNSGLAQGYIDRPTLNYVMELDRLQHDAIFAFVSPDLPLEIKYNRIINIDPVNADLKTDAEDYQYKGHAGPLYIVLPADYLGARANIIINGFAGYNNFELIRLSKKYILYRAK